MLVVAQLMQVVDSQLLAVPRPAAPAVPGHDRPAEFDLAPEFRTLD